MKYKSLKSLTQTDFGYFLAGLIDADGYIRKGELAFTLNDLDKAMGRSLMAIFGGRMRPYKTRNGFNYELNDSLMLKVIADLIRHKLVLNHRRQQYRTWAPTLNVAKTCTF